MSILSKAASFGGSFCDKCMHHHALYIYAQGASDVSIPPFAPVIKPLNSPPSITHAMSSSPSMPMLLVVMAAVLMASTSPAVHAIGGNIVSVGDKRTHACVYVHETRSGPNATYTAVARSPLGENATFGEVGVLDNALRDGPDAASRLVGRYQSVFVGTDQDNDDGDYTEATTVVFTDGEHRGSTLSLLGLYRFPAVDALERAVVGGTGKFRMARGYSKLKVVRSSKDAAVYQLDLFMFTPHGKF
ncbi:hypothetical protein ACP70R_004748 [Stipagrostis hirtigluma subsp. patula]